MQFCGKKVKKKLVNPFVGATRHEKESLILWHFQHRKVSQQEFYFFFFFSIFTGKAVLTKIFFQKYNFWGIWCRSALIAVNLCWHPKKLETHFRYSFFLSGDRCHKPFCFSSRHCSEKNDAACSHHTHTHERIEN